MSKLIGRSFIIIILLTFFSLLYLTFYGLETNYFNPTIQKKIKEFNPNFNLKFKNTKILLDIKKLQLKVKVQDPWIEFYNKKTELNKLNINISIRSLLKKEFALKRSEVGLVKTEIKKIIELIQVFKPSPFLFIFKEITNEGQISAEVKINFDHNGKIVDDYKIKADLFDFDAHLLKKFNLKKIQAEIELIRNYYQIYLTQGNINGINVANSEFRISKEDKNFNVEGNLFSKAENKEIKNIFYLLNSELNKDLIEESKISLDIKTAFSFQLKKYVKIKNLLINGKGKINLLNIKHKIDTSRIKKIFINYNNSIQIKDTNLKFSSDQNRQNIELEGLINLTNKYEKFNSKIILDKKKKYKSFDTWIDIESSNIKLSSLNYEKEIGVPASIKFKGIHKKNKGYNLDIVEFKESDNLILINGMDFNEKIQINDIKKLIVQTTHKNSVNNRFKLDKDQNIQIQGTIFDARPLLKNLYKSNKRKLFSKNFNEKISINFEKIINDNENNLSGFSMISEVKNGEYVKLSAKGNFSKNEIIEASIYKRDNDKKIIHVISDRAEPFIIGLNFIKGFKGGKLEYESTNSKGISNSKIKILNFKVSKVPALTQLLTLASLQGIADTLTGEGIRFSELEMDLNSKKNTINVEEMYAIGPAISLLLNGYVDKGKIVSLKGTLVPASTIQKTIGKIPLLGDILVGKKVGEGVFGVSFKMKGPPNDIRTTVNPIKTLTPRFVTRTLEKIKELSN